MRLFQLFILFNVFLLLVECCEKRHMSKLLELKGDLL
jgi:hypothetical protein